MPWQSPPDLGEKIGRLLERADETRDQLRRIDTRTELNQRRLDLIDMRLWQGDAIMGRQQEAIEKLTSAVERLDKPPKPEALMPGWERLIKAAAPWLVLPLAAWGTGSWQAAVEIVRVLGVRAP